MSGSGEWAGPPRTTLKLVSSPDQFESIHRYHNLGFRGEEIAILKRTDQRIICIGDSWTEGIGANESQTWPAVLATNLPSSQYEVINLGDAGATPERYLEILAKVGVALKPTTCIVCINPSDLYGGPKIPSDLSIRRLIRDEFRQRDSKISTVCANWLPGWMYLLDRSQGRWHQRDGIYWNCYEIPKESIAELIANRGNVTLNEAESLLNERIKSLEPLCVESAKKQSYNGYRIDLELWNPHASYKCTTKDMGVSTNELEQATIAWLGSFAKTCQDSEIQPILCLFPEAGLVSRSPVGPMVDDFYLDAPDITSDQSVTEMLKRICSEQKVSYIDCTNELRSHSEAPLFLRYDGHPNSRAYKVVGEWIAAKVRR